MQIPLPVSTRIMAAAENENERDLHTDEESEFVRALNGYARAVATNRQDETNGLLGLFRHYQAKAAAWQQEAKRQEAQARAKLASLENALAAAKQLQTKLDQMGDLALANGAEIGAVNNIKCRP